MIRSRNLTLSPTVPTELTIPDAVEGPCTLIISNDNANKHIYIGNGNTSSTNYGLRLEHDVDPFTIELSSNDRLYAVGQDETTTVAVLIIER